MLTQVRDCDWLGAAIVLSWGVCFILGLEKGGIKESWKSADVIVLLVMIPILAIVFFTWEQFRGKKAMLPLHMLNNPTIRWVLLLLALHVLVGTDHLGTVGPLSCLPSLGARS